MCALPTYIHLVLVMSEEKGEGKGGKVGGAKLASLITLAARNWMGRGRQWRAKFPPNGPSTIHRPSVQ